MPLTLAQLERHLFSAADILRGRRRPRSSRSSFGALFLKRCSDVFEARHDEIVRSEKERGRALAEALAGRGSNGSKPSDREVFAAPSALS